MEASINTKHGKFNMEREQARTEWLEIWNYYQELKIKYNLTSHDILKQLNAPCSYQNLELLSERGDRHTPSNKPGTNGKESRDLLAPGLSKTDWLLPFPLTYIEKLTEMQCNGHFSIYSVHVIDDKPTLEIGVNHNEYYPGTILYQHDKDEFARLFTIDGIVPEIKDIKDFYWC